MLECRACVLRCLRAVAGDSTLPINGTLILTPRITATIPSRRKHTTAVTTASQDAFGTRYKPSGRTTPKEENAQLTSTSTQRALQTELKFLNDPLKLASHIHYVLRQNDPAKALDLARLASKSAKSAGDVIVAWNHCVDWHMRSGRVSEGVRIYNEMKKRGVFPDAHTYTLLFRSFIPKSENGVDEATVAKATNIYYSMLTPTSRVKPGIIHTNAVLRVCSLAGDMDALWGVASKIPERGPGSADTVTYTILLSAIRFGAMGFAHDGVYLEQIGGKRQGVVNEGRRIWMECIQKWRSGDLVIDAELVAQMGNLLLISNRMEDWDDVLSLVEQTTRIPRQIVPLDHPDRRIGHVPQETLIGDDVEQSPPSEEEEQEGFLPTPASKAFQAIPTTKSTSSPIWVTPGNPILSVLIQACLKMRIPKAANAYWDIITSQHSLVPDLANYQSMLRLYRLNRSSAKAVALIEKMHSADGGSVSPRGLTYRDAMAVCARDHKNPSIMNIANRIMDDMKYRLRDPDVQALLAYLSLATTTDSTFEIQGALNRLEVFRPMIMSRIDGSQERRDVAARTDRNWNGNLNRMSSQDPDQKFERREREAAIGFVKLMASSIQKLIETGSVTKAVLNDYMNRRNQLNRCISFVQNRHLRNRHNLDAKEEIPNEPTKLETDRQSNPRDGATGTPDRTQYQLSAESGIEVTGKKKMITYHNTGPWGKRLARERAQYQGAARPGTEGHQMSRLIAHHNARSREHESGKPAVGNWKYSHSGNGQKKNLMGLYS